jgi:hypothetical protein
MMRLFALVLGALLAFLSLVYAKTTDMNQVRLYEFTNPNCAGFHKHANVDLEQDKCVKIRGLSFKVMMDLKRMDWLSAVNNGTWSCSVTYYADDHCQETYYDDTIPEHTNDCMKDGNPCQDQFPACPLGLGVRSRDMGSAMFSCTDGDAIV